MIAFQSLRELSDEQIDKETLKSIEKLLSEFKESVSFRHTL
jgi:HD-GYP domain-containing protein (c-di-GMP phosphodiesterase class II)